MTVKPLRLWTNLTGGQDNGGELWAVPPLCQEGEGEGLEEDGRDQAVPPSLGQGGACSSLYVWGPIRQFRPLELHKEQ